MVKKTELLEKITALEQAGYSDVHELEVAICQLDKKMAEVNGKSAERVDHLTKDITYARGVAEGAMREVTDIKRVQRDLIDKYDEMTKTLIIFNAKLDVLLEEVRKMQTPLCIPCSPPYIPQDIRYDVICTTDDHTEVR